MQRTTNEARCVGKSLASGNGWSLRVKFSITLTCFGPHSLKSATSGMEDEKVNRGGEDKSTAGNDGSGGDVPKSKNFHSSERKAAEMCKKKENEKSLKTKAPRTEAPDTEMEKSERTPGAVAMVLGSEDADFQVEKKGMRKKRQRDEELLGELSDFTEGLPLKKRKNMKTEQNGEAGPGLEMRRKMKMKTSEETVKVKKQEDVEYPVSVKRKEKEELEATKAMKLRIKEERMAVSALKIKMKEEEERQRWRWWEEERYERGIKWKFLEHKGPYFPPEYHPLPDNVRFFYNGKPVKLSPSAEEVALFFAQMLDHEYTTKDVFRNNFFKDWRKVEIFM